MEARPSRSPPVARFLNGSLPSISSHDPPPRPYHKTVPPKTAIAPSQVACSEFVWHRVVSRSERPSSVAIDFADSVPFFFGVPPFAFAHRRRSGPGRPLRRLHHVRRGLCRRRRQQRPQPHPRQASGTTLQLDPRLRGHLLPIALRVGAPRSARGEHLQTGRLGSRHSGPHRSSQRICAQDPPHQQERQCPKEVSSLARAEGRPRVPLRPDDAYRHGHRGRMEATH